MSQLDLALPIADALLRAAALKERAGEQILDLGREARGLPADVVDQALANALEQALDDVGTNSEGKQTVLVYAAQFADTAGSGKFRAVTRDFARSLLGADGQFGGSAKFEGLGACRAFTLALLRSLGDNLSPENLEDDSIMLSSEPLLWLDLACRELTSQRYLEYVERFLREDQVSPKDLISRLPAVIREYGTGTAEEMLAIAARTLTSSGRTSEINEIYALAEIIEPRGWAPPGTAVKAQTTAGAEGRGAKSGRKLNVVSISDFSNHVSRDVLKELIEHLSEGVIMFEQMGKVTIANAAFRALWGIAKPNDLAGLHINDVAKLCQPSYDQPNGWPVFISWVTSTDRPDAFQGTLELDSGLVVDYAFIPLPNGQTMLTFVNMTDTVRVERALTERNEALSRADHLKNDFVQHISYELRSPLTTIMGMTEFLRTPGIDLSSEKRAEYLDSIALSSEVLLTLVNDILDLATVDAGIVKLQLGNIAIDELLDDVALTLAPVIERWKVTLAILAPDNLGQIVADRHRVKQTFVKLIAHMAEFAPEESSITLTCKRQGTDLVFAVADEGPKIASDELGFMFERFASVHPRSRGMGGLALSIVKTFVELHGGKVTVRSTNSGTTITCTIPDGSSGGSSKRDSEQNPVHGAATWRKLR